MTTWTRIALVALAVAASKPAIAGTDEPFGATAAELRALAKAAEPSDAAAVILVERGRYVYDDAGRRSFRLHRIVEIKSRQGIEEWGSVQVGWAPWYQSKPTIRARVLTRDDRFRSLDPSTIEDASSQDGDAHSYSDWRGRRAPLPAVSAGAIVEIESEVVDHEPFFAAGSVDRFYFAASSVPIALASLEIDVPKRASLRYEVSLLPGLVPEVERRGERRRYLFERRNIPAHTVESSLPPDAARYPVVAFTLGRSWAKVASSYARVVDAQIAAGPVPDAALPEPGRDRDETIARALAHLHRNVRYTGLEFGQNAIVPWTPAETWKRGYGDCKDKATLLVAMLRRLGIDAHVALLDSGDDRDVRPKLPGLGDFDHAIAYIPGRKPIWIDATVELARAGQLPYGDQGRRALIARRGARRLVTLPADRAGENRIVEDRRIELPSYGSARVVETTRYHGLQELRWRYEYRDARRDQVAGVFASYIEDEYSSKTLVSHSIGDTGDLGATFSMEIVAGDANIASVDLGEAIVNLPVGQLGQLLPPELRIAGPDEPPPTPREQPLSLVPHATVQRYRIVPPPGFSPKTLPKVSHRVAGPLRIVRDVVRDGDEVVVTFEMAITRDLASPAEVAAMRSVLAKFWKEDQDSVAFEQRAVAKATAGEILEAIASQRAIVAAKPDDASDLARLAHLLGEAGLGLESRRLARLAVAADPDALLARIVLGDACSSDELGRWGGRGLDRRCALEAYGWVARDRPDLTGVRANHAILLSLDDRGFELGGAPEQAAEGLVAVVEAGDHEYDEVAVSALAATGQFARLAELVPKLDSEGQAHVARIVSIAGTKGAGAAIAELEALPALYQSALATTVAALIANSRSWDLYRALYAGLARSELPTPTLSAMAVSRLGTKRPAPVELVARALVASAFALRPGDPELREAYASASLAAYRADPDGFAGRSGMSWGSAAGTGAGPEVFAEVLRATIDVSIVGRSSRVRRLQAKFGGDRWELVAVRERGDFRLLGPSSDLGLLGAQALSLADAGKLADARFLLDIAAESRPTKLEPFASPAFYRLWTEASKQDRRAVTVAAAALAVEGPMRTRSLEVLAACARGGERARVCSEALLATRAGSYEWDQTTAELSTFADVATGTWPALDVARVQARREGDQERARLIARMPAHGQLMMRALAALHRGDHDAALRAYQELAKQDWSGAGRSANLAAWIELFVERPRLRRAEKMAELATADDPNSSRLHTLATVQAARGDVAGARETLAKVVDARGGMDASTWLVYGRIASECGAVEAARAAYDRTIADHGSGVFEHISSAALAKRWRDAL